jgi:small nuclear ribonucleoprotein (snRNP)-like protein
MKRLKSLALTLTLIVVPLAQIARPQSGSLDKAAKIKSEVAKRLANNKTRVKIKLLSGEEVKGRLERADDSGFTLIEDKTGRKIDLAYNAVDRLKGRGGLSTAAKIGIIAGAAVVVVGVVVYLGIRNTDYFRGGIRIP